MKVTPAAPRLHHLPPPTPRPVRCPDRRCDHRRVYNAVSNRVCAGRVILLLVRARPGRRSHPPSCLDRARNALAERTPPCPPGHLGPLFGVAPPSPHCLVPRAPRAAPREISIAPGEPPGMSVHNRPLFWVVAEEPPALPPRAAGRLGFPSWSLRGAGPISGTPQVAVVHDPFHAAAAPCSQRGRISRAALKPPGRRRYVVATFRFMASATSFTLARLGAVRVAAGGTVG